MSLSANDIRDWLVNPVTRWVVDSLQKDYNKLETKLKKDKFQLLEEVVAAQTELRSLEKWIVQPEQRLKQLLNRGETAEE